MNKKTTWAIIILVVALVIIGAVFVVDQEEEPEPEERDVEVQETIGEAERAFTEMRDEIHVHIEEEGLEAFEDIERTVYEFEGELLELDEDRSVGEISDEEFIEELEDWIDRVEEFTEDL